MKRLILTLLLIITFCYQAALAETKSLTIMLDWFVNPNHAPLLVGQEEGIFAKHGLNVNLVPPADPSDPIRFAAINKVNLALTYQPQWLIQQGRGVPISWVATLVDQPLTVVIADAKKVPNAKALKGQSIGYSEGAVASVFLKTMLTSQQLTVQDVNLINVHYGLVQALLAQRVAAISGAMRNVEPYELDEKHFAYRLFKPEDYGVPPYAELIFVAQQDHVNDPKFKAFIQALSESVAYLKQHPELTWQHFAKAYPELNNAMNHKIWLQSIGYFTNNPGAFDEVRNKKLKDFLIKNGVMNRA